MIRRFNYTGRRKLPTSCATVHLYRQHEAPSEFEIELRLEGQKLPQDAQVYVEAYYRSSMMRFPFGSMQDVQNKTSNRYVLSDLQNTIAFFRVKVVDESTDFGRIIAVIERIKPMLPEETDASTASLLFVEYVDLGQLIWRVDIAEDHAMPILQVNSELNTATSVQEFVRYDPGFMSLVYPAAVREILTYILQNDNLPDTDEENWKSEWLRFGLAFTGEKLVPDFYNFSVEERAEWIDEAVNAFCAHNHLKEKLEQSLGNEPT